MRSFECSSVGELDRQFYGEQSLSAAEQLSISRADGADVKPSVQFASPLQLDTSSPFRSFSLNVRNLPDADSYHLNVPLQGKSSTPQVLPPVTLKPTATGLDLSWDVSMIKSDSPRLELEQAWSPKQPPNV